MILKDSKIINVVGYGDVKLNYDAVKLAFNMAMDKFVEGYGTRNVLPVGEVDNVLDFYNDEGYISVSNRNIRARFLVNKIHHEELSSDDIVFFVFKDATKPEGFSIQELDGQDAPFTTEQLFQLIEQNQNID